ncbi:MAG: response regulator [candidate division Zixibacteria bacterium]|nr:response regulator [candidate division Zixibacteria bacterium]MDH3937279.1 response regulator [candidate division Zixibacteria bacterium]MDH4033337.1 response regulator [candidate division Zixibacteria bacterium]
MSRKRILFVFANEQSATIEGIRQILARRQNEWEVEFVTNGAEALRAMKRCPSDIVLTDLDMPTMTGVELLKQISDLYPGTIRFIQTDASDRKVMLESTSIAHRLISKPCNPETLRGFLTTSLGLREVLAMEELHIRIAAIGTLPSPPEMYNRLMNEIQSDTVSIGRIAALISEDISLTAKLLQMINSAYFGLSRHVDNVTQAVNLLGLEAVRGLVLTAGAFSQFDFPALHKISIESIYGHSMAVGSQSQKIAEAIGLPRPECDEALMAGMLHDIGKLVMLTHFRAELQEALELADEKSIPFHEAERKVLNVTHAEIGTHLLSLWGLPDSILEPVALHHDPERMPIPQRTILTAVHMADALHHERNPFNVGDESSLANQSYLDKIGVTDVCEQFRQREQTDPIEEPSA